MASLFYDNQIRRFLIQFARIFSNWEVENGTDDRGNPIVIRVPIMYGDMSRQAATIMANNSANNLPKAPLITYYIKNIEYDQSRTQEPYFLDRRTVRQRSYNAETREYETVQGQAFEVQRIMPVPYKLSLTVDIWTTNYQQKLQIWEQLAVLFNPSMEIQSTDNFIDWTSLSVVYQDGINWTSRSIPLGTGNPIDVLSWGFQIPVWISSAVKINKMGIIHKVIASIYKGSALTDMKDDDLLLGTRQKITPYGYQILFLGNTLQLLPASQPKYPGQDSLEIPQSPDTSLYWSATLGPYGAVKNGISMIALENPYLDNEILGTISFDPLDDRVLKYTIDPDTLPTNTLEAIDRVIDPLTQGPGVDLPVETPGVPGKRYIVLNDVGSGASGKSLEVLQDYPAGTTEFSVSGLATTAPEAWFYSILTARDESGVAIFPINTQIVDLDPVAGTIMVDNPSQVNMKNGTIIDTTNRVYGYAWGDLICRRDDIIQWDGGRWIVSWSGDNVIEQQFVINNYSNIQYRWGPGEGWSKSVEGFYDQGSWRVII
jgi:hypothetical protein